MRNILQSDTRIRRGLHECGYVDKLLAMPQAYFMRIHGSKLWHLSRLEWWLQVHVKRVSAGALHV